MRLFILIAIFAIIAEKANPFPLLSQDVGHGGVGVHGVYNQVNSPTRTDHPTRAKRYVGYR